MCAGLLEEKVLVAVLVILVFLESQAGPQQLGVGRVGRSERIGAPTRRTQGWGCTPLTVALVRRWRRAVCRDELLDVLVAVVGVLPRLAPLP